MPLNNKLVMIFCSTLFILSCSKPFQESTNEVKWQKITLADLPLFQNDSRDFSLVEIMDMAKKFDVKRADVNSKSTGLTPLELKYGLETALNRDFNAGGRSDGQIESNLFIYDIQYSSDGKCANEYLDDIYNSIAANIELIETTDRPFYIVDVELTTTNSILVDIVTSNFYLNNGLSFGFNLFNENANYSVFSNSFVQDVNDRLILEYVDPEDYFLTDIWPNPSQQPLGLTISATDAIGELDFLEDCDLYKGTKLIYGGPELIFGAGFESTMASGSQINPFITRALDYITDPIPTDIGFILISLKFGKTFNPDNNSAGIGCLPNSPCDPYYPCYRYKHNWTQGRIARKAVYEK